MNRPMRALALVVAAGASLLASGCLVSPGTFTSELTLRRDGSFAFAYKGDIHLLGLSQMARDEAAGAAAPFVPSACSGDDGEERKCSDDELAQQRTDWQQAQDAAAKKRAQDAEMMKNVLGGIDPSDPRAAEEFAARLRRQAGWRSVVDKGNGRFEVDFALAGRLDHDFVFPTIERLPVVTPFVTLARRADGSVRVDAPAFSNQANGGPMAGMLGGLSESASERERAGVPPLDGSFAVVTDGEILANNTDEGAAATAAARRLTWKVNARTASPPSALIKLR